MTQLLGSAFVATTGSAGDGGIYVLDQILNGLSVGSIYAFIALGYTMVYGIIKLINFAHGEFFMVGSMLGYFVFETAGHSMGLGTGGAAAFAIVLSMLTAAVGTGLLAVLTERLAYRPLQNASRIAALLTALGVSILLQNLAARLFTAEQKGYPDILPPAWKQIIVIGSLVVAFGVLMLIVKRTELGRAMRAVSYNFETARLMGIESGRVIAWTFFIGAFCAGVGGVIWGLRYGNANPFMGAMPGLKAFIAAVIGGIGSLPGALLGGILLGVLEVLIVAFMPSEYTGYKDVVAFLALILILTLKPQGLLGRFEGQKV
jgi:branched-chain amino acid transport system permease protein